MMGVFSLMGVVFMTLELYLIIKCMEFHVEFDKMGRSFVRAISVSKRYRIEEDDSRYLFVLPSWMMKQGN